jgi:hypothetical protein
MTNKEHVDLLKLTADQLRQSANLLDTIYQASPTGMSDRLRREAGYLDRAAEHYAAPRRSPRKSPPAPSPVAKILT